MKLQRTAAPVFRLTNFSGDDDAPETCRRSPIWASTGIKGAIGRTDTLTLNALSHDQHKGTGGVTYGRPGRIAGSSCVPASSLFGTDKTFKPIGELRVRVVIQRYASGWSTCRDSGYVYNTSSTWSWLVGIDMGSYADCGSGSYRAWGYAAVYQAGAWRGSSLVTLGLPLR